MPGQIEQEILSGKQMAQRRRVADIGDVDPHPPVMRIRSAMLAGLAPPSGTMLSSRTSSAPSPASRRANAEPISPTPPVISTRALRKAVKSGSRPAGTRLGMRQERAFGRCIPTGSTSGRGVLSDEGADAADRAAGFRQDRREGLEDVRHPRPDLELRLDAGLA